MYMYKIVYMKNGKWYKGRVPQAGFGIGMHGAPAIKGITPIFGIEDVQDIDKYISVRQHIESLFGRHSQSVESKVKIITSRLEVEKLFLNPKDVWILEAARESVSRPWTA